MLALTRTLLTPVVIALAVAAVVAFVVVVVVRGSGSSPALGVGTPTVGSPSRSASVLPTPSHQPWIHWSSVVPKLSCSGVGTIVDSRRTGDLNADGRPDAVISAHCDAGAGSPPSVVEVYVDQAGHPRVLGDIVSTGDDLLVQHVAVSGGLVRLTAKGYSPGTARCCPDRTVDQTWRVRTAAGTDHLVRVH